MCWAAGYYLAGNTQTLIERWDGNSWTLVTSPSNNPDAATCVANGQLPPCELDNYLFGVACASDSECWADGYYVDFNNDTVTLMERWDGSSWTIVPSANPVSQRNLLYGLTCTSQSDCWASGFTYVGAYQTLIEHWDGTSWSVVSTPNASTNQLNVFYGVTCASALDCWAVGFYYNDSFQFQTLIEHYPSPPVQLNAVVSRKVHGSAGTFDVDLPLTGNPGIECRSGGANSDYTLVFRFANPLTYVERAATTTPDNGFDGSVGSSYIDTNDPHNYIVNVTGTQIRVVNAQVMKVILFNVEDSAGEFSSSVSAQMGLLLGDVNGSGRVDAADVSLVRQQTLQPLTSTNFREDINTSGRIDAADVSIARQQTLTSLP
jgi:hypothetical protein